MAVNRNTYTNTVTRSRQDNPHTYIKFFQLNLQHSRVATDNLVKLIAEQGTKILLLQEPFKIQNKTVGIPKRHKIFTHDESGTMAAIAVTNNPNDTLLTKQLSDSDTVVLELTLDNARIVLAGMYLDINQHIDDNLLGWEGTGKIINPSAWGHLNPSSYYDVGRLFCGVCKLWSKLCRSLFKIM